MTSDVRQRRAERAKRERFHHLLPRYGKYALIGIIAVAVVAAAATFYKPPAVEAFAHDHATFGVFIGGQDVGFSHPDYDASKRGHGPPHMHSSDGRAVWHIEGRFPGGKPDLTLEDLFVYHSVKFRGGSMQLDTMAGHNGTEWRDQGNATWQVFVSRMAGDQRAPFEGVEGDISQYVPQNMEKVLITYGEPTPADLARQQSLVPAPPGDSGGPA